MTYLYLLPSMMFCALGVILTCLAIFQVRRERRDIFIRMNNIEDTMEILKNHFWESVKIQGGINKEFLNKNIKIKEDL